MKRREYLQTATATSAAITGIAASGGVVSAEVPLNPEFITAREVGSYDPSSYNSVKVRIFTAEHDSGSVSASTAEEVLYDVETMLDNAVSNASNLDGARVEAWDTTANFSGLSDKKAHWEQADELMWGSKFENDQGNNIWLQPDHTQSYPAKYEPTVYTPSYNTDKVDGEADFPHSFAPGEKLRDGLHWGPCHENLHNMFYGYLSDGMEGNCGNIEAHTLATSRYDSGNLYATLMARPSSDELECGECSTADKGGVDYHSLFLSDCEVTAIEDTVSWAKSKDR